MMKIASLEALNVDRDLLDIWQGSVGDHLLPVQERAVRELGLLGPHSTGNLIVFSPTSSGKTFVGEMAAVQAARQDRKVFYLVPLKALAEEKYQEFRDRYEGAGIRVVVSSRDHAEFDENIAKLQFGIAVVVYEKLQALLVGYPDLIEHTGLVVVDELQLITDTGRGPALELLLTKLITATNRPRIIGLSAVLGNAERLARWLDAQLLVEHHRPLELRKGVLHAGTFRYREHNSGMLGSEEFPDSGAVDRREIVLSAVEHLVGLGEQVLVFEETRGHTRENALLAADRLRLPIAQEGLDALAHREETEATLNLRRAFESSVAFHNSDLAPEERALVERLVRSGAIRAVFSTPTLAMGVNLPVKNVIVPTYKYAYLKRYRKTSRVQLAKGDYENMSGRAGRYSLTEDFGRSLLVTPSKWDAKVWMDSYVDAELEKPQPTLEETALDEHLLDLLVSKLVSTSEEAAEVLARSFTGQSVWLQKLGQQELMERLSQAADRCRAAGMLTESRKVLIPTTLGKVCAATGIRVATAEAFADWLEATADLPVAPLDVLTALTFTADADDSYVPMSTREYHNHQYGRRLVREARELELLDRPEIRRIHESKYSLLYEDAKQVKKALMLHAWIQEHRTAEIERGYLVWGGAILRVAEEYGWLAEALVRAAEAQKWSTSKQRDLRLLGWRIRAGVKEDLLPLAQLRVRGLGRVYMRRLADAGLADVKALKAASQEQLRAALNHRGLAERLHGHLHQDDGEECEDVGLGDGPGADAVELPAADTSAPPKPAVDTASSRGVATGCRAAEESPKYGEARQEREEPRRIPHTIHLVGTCRQRRYLVKLAGRDVWLPNQLFRVLSQLVLHRLDKPSGWIHQADLGVASGAYRALSRLRKILEPFPGPGGNGWFENNGNGGYRILPQVEVGWDEQGMRSEHPDLVARAASR